ncbi:MAG: hypothetical protein J3Q66DRAFT_407200 [Benniella sp.]|nr:MAG: hypothetical protein J3Q66DRAFT_407200 [Benniella sp.]
MKSVLPEQELAVRLSYLEASVIRAEKSGNENTDTGRHGAKVFNVEGAKDRVAIACCKPQFRWRRETVRSDSKIGQGKALKSKWIKKDGEHLAREVAFNVDWKVGCSPVLIVLLNDHSQQRGSQFCSIFSHDWSQRIVSLVGRHRLGVDRRNTAFGSDQFT